MASVDLPEPDFADDAEDLARIDAEADGVVAGNALGLFAGQGGEERLAAEMDADILDLHQWLVCCNAIILDQPVGRIGNGRDQCAGVILLRVGEYLADVALLDDIAAIDDGNAACGACHQSKIMRDIERGNPGLGLQFDEQVEDLARGDHVECRGRLVKDDAFRVAGKSRRNDDALFLAARRLMRHAVHHPRWGFEAHVSKPCLAFLPRLLPGQATMADQYFGKLGAERQSRVKRRARILEHHADAPPAKSFHLAL